MMERSPVAQAASLRAEDDLEFLLLPPLAPRNWGFRLVPAHPVCSVLGIEPSTL